MEDFLQRGITQARKGDYKTAIVSFERAITLSRSLRIASNFQTAEAYFAED